MALSTPGARIPKWRSTLRFSYLLKINDTVIGNIQDVNTAVSSARTKKLFKLQCVFATEKSYGIHPIDGNLTIYFDQMDAFAKHVYEAEKEHRDQRRNAASSTNGIPMEEMSTRAEPKPPWHDYTETDGASTNLDDIIRIMEVVTPEAAQTDSSAPIATPDIIDPDLGKSFTLKQLLT
mmetsp:Transcript_1233/g.1894  ORF Transcript_1233/g.1894 Transcript_1233/m.1894 type:complete len:178 (+) Transcript_1233:3620-4153(+)